LKAGTIEKSRKDRVTTFRQRLNAGTYDKDK